MSPALLESLVARIADLHRRGTTFLIIEHNLDVVMELCRPIMVMASGRLLLEGDAATVQRDPRVVEAYLGGAPP